jgi:hypothetical protein
MMKKTLIAAGVAVAMTVPAIASADVSLTANLQAEIVNLSGNGARADGKGWYMGDAMSGGSFNAGNYSRVDLRSSHDLGNGVTAYGHVSMNMNPSEFPSGTREALVGLGGDFGRVDLGRMTTAYATAGKDPFNATFMQARGNGGMIGGFGGLGNGAYLNNAIGYNGKFGIVGLAGTFAIDQREDIDGGDSTNGNHAYALRVNMDFNPVEVWIAHTNADEYGLATQTVNDTGSASGGCPTLTACDFSATKVGAEFKTGAFTVMGQYEDIKHETDTGVTSNSEGAFMMLTGTYRMGANTFMLGYGQFDAENDNRDQTWIAAGMRHAFTRQVSAHAGVRQTEYDAGAASTGNKETAVGAGMRVVF